MSAPMNEQQFLDAMAMAATGVTIVTTNGPEGRAGLTVSAFTSVSASPPLVLVCINRKNAIVDKITSHEAFSINLLAEAQIGLSEIFAGRAGVERETGFTSENWQETEHGQLLLPSASAGFDCALHAHQDAGTHRIFIGEVRAVHLGESPALAYSRRDYRKLSD